MAVHEALTYADCSSALRAGELRQSLYDAAALMMERALVCLHGQEHRARRQEEGKVFRKDFFYRYEKDALPRTMAETIAPYEASGEADLVDLGYRIMMNLTIDFAGVDRPERSHEETTDLLRLLRAFSLAPALSQLDGVDDGPLRATIQAAMAEFDERYLRRSIQRRRALIAAHGADPRIELPHDVITMLLLAEETLALDEHSLLQEGIFLTLAGAHTSIHSLTHAVHEILTWAAANPDQAHRLKTDPFFVQRCVYESLRLHPSSPVARRRSPCPMAVPGVGDLAAGDEVVIHLRSANRDPAIFGGDADRFDPDRPVPAGQFGYGLSMGLGMHACLGRNLAVGVPARADTDPEAHHYGTVPLIASALLARGIRPDPTREARRDETITRISWAYYPVIFERT